MIPKKIHQIWFQGCERIPSRYKKSTEILMRNHPDWKYRCWSDREIKEECRKYSERCYSKYISFRYLHQKVDFGRYVILFNHGGVYVDIDCYSLKPLDNLLKVNKSLIVSYNPLNAIENAISTKSFTFKILNNGTILSSKHNRIMKDVIESIINSKGCTNSENKFDCIQRTTGPVFFTKEVASKENLAILPNKYLEPCYGMDSFCKPKAESYINHKHEGSWLSSTTVFLIKIYYFVKHNIKNFIIIIIIVVIISFLKRS